MAFDITATLTQSLRTKYNGQLDKNEYRRSNYGALRLFQNQTNDATGIVDQQLRDSVARSFGNTVNVPVVNYNDVTLSNVRTCAVQTSDLNTALVPVTFATLAFGIAIAPAMYRNNDLAIQDAFNKMLEARLIKSAALLDTAGVAFLNTNKNQYFPASITSYYAQVANALQVPNEDKAEFYNMLGSILSTMDYTASPDVLTNPMGMANVRQLNSNGQTNAINTAYALSGYEFYESNRVTNAAGVQSTLYAVAPGSLGFLTRFDPDVEMGSIIGDASNPSKQWSIQRNLPILDMDMGVYYQADCADKSAAMASGVSGLTRTKVESWEFSVDYAFIGAYNSAAASNFSPILKAEILLP